MGINIQGRVGWGAFPHTIGRSRLPHPTFHLLFNLLTHAEGFNATYSVITDQTGMSSKTIAAALNNLKKLDLVTVIKKKGKNGRFDSNQYTFHADRLWQITPEFVDERLRGKAAVGRKDGDADRCTRESGAALQGEAAPLYEGKTKKHQGERSVENDQSPLAPQGADGASAAGDAIAAEPLDPFDEWWEHVPRKKAKGDARKAFKTALKKTDLPTLIAGIEKSKRQWQTEGRAVSKIPYPATWLRSESWEDEQDTWQETSPQSGLAAWGAPSTQQQAPAGQNPFRSIYDEMRAING